MVKLIVGGKKDEELENIKNMTLDMFIQVEKMLELSKILLDTNDNSLALELIDEDKYVDDLKNDITIEINTFILIEQPKAIDLRQVLGTLQLINDLERIGDNCKTFAKTLIKTDIDQKKQEKLVNEVLELLLSRLKEVKVAYEKNDHYLAKSIAKHGDQIDELNNKLIAELNQKLVDAKDFKEVKGLTRTIVLAKSFQKSEDHLINMCEQISYINKGQLYHYS